MQQKNHTKHYVYLYKKESTAYPYLKKTETIWRKNVENTAQRSKEAMYSTLKLKTLEAVVVTLTIFLHFLSNLYRKDLDRDLP